MRLIEGNPIDAQRVLGEREPMVSTEWWFYQGWGQGWGANTTHHRGASLQHTGVPRPDPTSHVSESDPES